MTLQRSDNETLTKMILLCFDLSTDGGVPAEFRPDFLVLGKRLRGTLINLLSAQFDSQTPQFVEANAKIMAVNRALNETANDLARFADTIEQVGKLIGTLDGLLTIAVSFI
jgi:hypothetical protein